MSTLIDFAVAVKAKVAASIAAARLTDGTLPAAVVKRSWDPIIQTPEAAKELESRTVYVIPIDEEFREASDRANDRNVYLTGLIVADRIPGELMLAENEDDLTAWIDAAVGWVNNLVYEPLTAVDYSPVTGSYLESGDIREIVKRGVIREFQLFWSEIDLAYFIEESNA